MRNDPDELSIYFEKLVKKYKRMLKKVKSTPEGTPEHKVAFEKLKSVYEPIFKFKNTYRECMVYKRKDSLFGTFSKELYEMMMKGTTNADKSLRDNKIKSGHEKETVLNGENGQPAMSPISSSPLSTFISETSEGKKYLHNNTKSAHNLFNRDGPKNILDEKKYLISENIGLNYADTDIIFKRKLNENFLINERSRQCEIPLKSKAEDRYLEKNTIFSEPEPANFRRIKNNFYILNKIYDKGPNNGNHLANNNVYNSKHINFLRKVANINPKVNYVEQTPINNTSNLDIKNFLNSEDLDKINTGLMFMYDEIPEYSYAYEIFPAMVREYKKYVNDMIKRWKI